MSKIYTAVYVKNYLVLDKKLRKMGSIISSRRSGEKIILEVLSDYNELLQLKGHLDDVHLFTEKVAEVKTNISQRGKNEATKYFLIPRKLRKGFKFDNTTSCQRVDLQDKVIFVYVVDKMKTNPSKRVSIVDQIKQKYA